MSSSFIRQFLTIAAGCLIICSQTRADNEMMGPIIIPTKSEIILKRGQNFTIFCKSNMPVVIKQQHIPEENIGPFTMEPRNVSSSDDMYQFETALDLYNVDRYAIGYYACFDSTLKEDTVLYDLTKEPTNTEHVSYFYIYVDDTGELIAPMRQMVMSTIGATIVIECRPTTPDVNVTLFADFLDSDYSFSPKIGFTFSSEALLDIQSEYSCSFVRHNLRDKIEVYVHKLLANDNKPKPNIETHLRYFLEGETFLLNCTIEYELGAPINLKWYFSQQSTQQQRQQIIVKNFTNEHSLKERDILYNAIVIANATADNDGVYTCVSDSVAKEEVNTTKIYKGNTGFIYLKNIRPGPISTRQGYIRLKAEFDSYPPAELTLYKDDQKIQVTAPKYEIKKEKYAAILKITELNVYDIGNYTIVATNKDAKKNITFDLRKEAAPVITFGQDDKKYLLNTMATLQCEAIGYPLPNIRWYFTTETGQYELHDRINNTVHSLIKVTSQITIRAYTTGDISCSAENKLSPKAVASRRLIVYDVPGGFGIVNIEKNWFSEGGELILHCYASKYDFDSVTWSRGNDTLTDFVTILETNFSYIAQINKTSLSREDAGSFNCLGYKQDNLEANQTISITVAARRWPKITVPANDSDEEVKPYQPVRLTCQADSVPPPNIIWYKDDEVLENNTIGKIYTDYITHTTVNSTIDIAQMLDEHRGKYECVASNGDKAVRGTYNLIIKDGDTFRSAVYLYIIGVIAFVLVLLIAYLLWKIRKEKQFKKEMAAAGLLYFNAGVPKSLNPDLSIVDQPELLPYDKRFEFPPEKLHLGKQLGAGAFGVVYKAEASGIINAEETTTVAVKMVKKTADNMYIKALASELKIMVHLGKHVNIVNLLGACTKNVGKRELVVIVEYCKFGNIHNYMQRHREVFIDQLTDNKEKNLGKVNRAFITSTGSNGMHSDYYGSNHSQDTDHTFVNSANTNRSGRKVSETGYVQPEWRSNYESDYSFDGRNPRPLSSRDLLAWAFQIARGMEYLANRKVLHGDLAARNVLLAEDNIVKICDFGLARSIYKNDEYKKKENSPLPVKWLAIECMTDRIFSTQSDVWSFGIVLWELFSLAKTPYPNVSPTGLVQWLSEGHRLEKPQYADDRLYDVMKRCWEQKPTVRPNFGQLQEILGSFLEDNVRNHYVDLNSAFMDMNLKTVGEEDYLAMVCAPDYNNMVTPSPHHYVNEPRSFFPPNTTELLHDDEGYLQMSPANQSIFSPRAPSTKFEYDARKLNQMASEFGNSQGSELTPMLSLNNLPARSGSESDHDGNLSPYLNMCPKIDEESDEVFETKQYNILNIQNNQNRAVTNPTYITLNVDMEKKPQNISNNYINVPNGLVK